MYIIYCNLSIIRYVQYITKYSIFNDRNLLFHNFNFKIFFNADYKKNWIVQSWQLQEDDMNTFLTHCMYMKIKKKKQMNISNRKY